jgi:hypothetical protein
LRSRDGIRHPHYVLRHAQICHIDQAAIDLHCAAFFRAPPVPSPPSRNTTSVPERAPYENSAGVEPGTASSLRCRRAVAASGWVKLMIKIIQ